MTTEPLVNPDSDPEPAPRDPVAEVLAALRSTGFPLELDVARAFKQAGASYVEQSRHYLDARTQELRESDVLATFHRMTRLDGSEPFLEFRVVVECKHSNAPWAVFRGADRFLSWKAHLETLDVVSYRDCAPDLTGDAPLVCHTERNFAFGVQAVPSRGNSGDRSAAYNAVEQVNSATLGFKRDMMPQEGSGRRGVVILVPAVVTTAPLVECTLDSTGSLVGEEVDMTLLVSRLRADRWQSVWLVNAQAVDRFADMCRKSFENVVVLAPGQ
jgi:hypothetical protein